MSETESLIELRCGCGASLFVNSYWLPGVESSTIERFQMEHRCRCEGDGDAELDEAPKDTTQPWLTVV